MRILSIVDDFTREAVALIVDTSIGGQRLACELDAVIARRRKPLVIVSVAHGNHVARSRLWRHMCAELLQKSHYCGSSSIDTG